MPFGKKVPDSETVNHRQIKGGYLVTRDGVKAGKKFTEESFSKTRPRVITGGTKRPSAGASDAKGATKTAPAPRSRKGADATT